MCKVVILYMCLKCICYPVGIIVHSYIIRKTPHEIYPAPHGKTGAEYVLTAVSHSNYLIFSAFILRASIL